MDLIERIKEKVNEQTVLPVEMQIGYLDAVESLVIYSLAGSTTTQEYMDGAKDVNVNYEVAMKSKDGALAEKALWQISETLDSLNEITSEDNSYIFNKLRVTSKPFINYFDDQGWFVFLLNFTVSITTNEEE